MRHILVLVSVLPLWCFGESGAQELRISSVFNQSDHDLLENPTGIAFSAGVPIYRRIGIRAEYQLSQDQFRSFGSTCRGGPIMPEMEDECAGEDRREESHHNALKLSVPITVLSLGRINVDVIPSYSRASVESDQTGLRSDRRRSANKNMSGFGIGAEVNIQPLRWRPLHVFLGAHRTQLTRYKYEPVIDGYSPFEEDISFTSIEVGVSYRR